MSARRPVRDIFAKPSGSAKRISQTQRSLKRQQAFGLTRMPRYVRPATDNKYIDLDDTAITFNSTGSLQLIYTIPQGTSVTTRVGKKIQVKSLQIRGYANTGTTQTQATTGWMYVIYDKQPTGSLPVITDIFEQISQTALLNDNNSDRFLVLFKKQFVFSGQVDDPALHTDQTIHPIDFYMKLHHKVVYKALGTGAIADFNYGAMYLVTFGDLASGTASPTGEVSLRTRFFDVHG